MTDNQDIRWQQRFSNYNKALAQLTKFIEKEELSELEAPGLIKSFEFTYELAWTLMKDYYEYQGVTTIQGSRDAIRMAFERGLIEEGDTWMEMIESRIRTAHTYNEETADEIADLITEKYYPLFITFRDAVEVLRSGEQGQLL